MKRDFSELYLEAPMDLEDAKDLRAILANKSVRRALGTILREVDEMDKLSTANLTRHEGVNEALVRQGTVQGIVLAVEKLIELGETEDER